MFFRKPPREEGELTWERHNIADLFLGQLFRASALLLNIYLLLRVTTTEYYLSSGAGN